MKRSTCGGRGFISLTITPAGARIGPLCVKVQLSAHALCPVHGPIVALAPTDPDPVVLDDVLVLTWRPGRGPSLS
jgi:hypothetical protein